MSNIAFDMAKIGYEEYSRQTGGESLATGASLPGWDDLPDNIKYAWEGSAFAIIRALGMTEETTTSADCASYIDDDGAPMEGAVIKRGWLKYRRALEGIRDFRKESNLVTTWQDAFSRLAEIARESLEEA